VADVAPVQQRSRLFGYVYLSASLAYVVGPLAGGKLADKHIVSWFDYATPFWAASGALGRRPRVANLGLVGWLARRMTARQMATRCSLVLGVAMARIVIPDCQAALWVTLGATALALALASCLAAGGMMSRAPEGRIGSR
jgi:MFS family permease